MPIGNPISLTRNVASREVTATATAGQTLFTITGGYRVNQIDVYQQGLKLSAADDFTAVDGSTVLLAAGATLNDELVFRIFDDFRVADAIVSAASSQTIFGNLNVNGELYADELDILNLSIGGLNITGVATVTDTTQSTSNTTGALIVSGGVGIAKSVNIGGDVDIDGNITIGGTLTYEDVTNVDSLGIITAREQINVGDYIQHLSDTDTRFGFPANDTFIVDTAGEERLRINSSGNVSIGTDAPVLNDNESLLLLHNDQGGQSGRIAFAIDVSSGYGVTFRQDDSGVNLFVNSNFRDFTINTGVSGDERLRVTNSGDVGIGTTSPHTNSALHISRDTFFDLTLERTGGSAGICTIGNRGNQMRLSNNVDGIRFDTGLGDNNVEERVRITAAGDVGIGTNNPTGTAALTNNTATLAVGVVTANTVYVGDGIKAIGIQSGGVNIAVGLITALNFVGGGNTFAYDEANKTVDINITGGATGPAGQKVFFENQRDVSSDYTLTAGYSAHSVGPVNVAAGVTVTVPAGERWVIL